MASKRKSLPVWWLAIKGIASLVGAVLMLVGAIGYGLAYLITGALCLITVAIAGAVDRRIADRRAGGSGKVEYEHSDCSSACRNSRAPKQLCRCPCGGKTHGRDRGMRKLLHAESRARANRGPAHPPPRERGRRVEKGGRPVREPIKPQAKPQPKPGGDWPDAGHEERERRLDGYKKPAPESKTRRASAERDRARVVRYVQRNGSIAMTRATPAQVKELQRLGRFRGYASQK